MANTGTSKLLRRLARICRAAADCSLAVGVPWRTLLGTQPLPRLKIETDEPRRIDLGARHGTAGDEKLIWTDHQDVLRNRRAISDAHGTEPSKQIEPPRRSPQPQRGESSRTMRSAAHEGRCAACHPDA